MMYPLSEKETHRRFGDTLHVAFLGAIAKDDGTVRQIFDGTHSVRLNNRIHIEDQLHFPGPPCVARAMELLQDEGHRLLVGVAADVAKIHPRVKHRPEDHSYLACRAREDGPIWLNRVGTLGMACTAYHFAWPGWLADLQTCPLFQFLFADDLKFFGGGARKYLDIWTILVFWLTVGAPKGSSWNMWVSPSTTSDSPCTFLRGGQLGSLSTWPRRKRAGASRTLGLCQPSPLLVETIHGTSASLEGGAGSWHRGSCAQTGHADAGLHQRNAQGRPCSDF